MEILMTEEAHFKLRNYIDGCPYEISGLGEVVVLDGNPFVKDIFLMEQTGGGTETDLTSDGQQAMLEAILNSGRPTEHMRLWWHSHPTFGAFMSGTDVNTINTIGPSMDEGWLLAICGNHKGEWFTRLDTFRPFKLVVEKLPIKVVSTQIEIATPTLFQQGISEITALRAQIKAIEDSLKNPIKDEIKNKVKPKEYKKYVPPTGGPSGTQYSLIAVKDDKWAYRNKYRCPDQKCGDEWISFGGLNEAEFCVKCMAETKPHHSERTPVEIADNHKEYPYMAWYECKKCRQNWSDLASVIRERDACPGCKDWIEPWMCKPRQDLPAEPIKSKDEEKVEERIKNRKKNKFSLLKRNQPQA